MTKKRRLKQQSVLQSNLPPSPADLDDMHFSKKTKCTFQIVLALLEFGQHVCHRLLAIAIEALELIHFEVLPFELESLDSLKYIH